MNGEIKCPQCAGNRAQELGANKYKCMYCGTVFSPTSSTSNLNEQATASSTSTSQSNQPIINVNVNTGSEQSDYRNVSSSYSRTPAKSRTTAALLAFFLGGFGGQHFYLGRTLLGVLCILFFWTWIPTLIGVVESIMFLCMSDMDFNRQYN